VREVVVPECGSCTDEMTFLACLAGILEFPLGKVPGLAEGEDPAAGWTVSRWLGGFGLGLARVAGPQEFCWAGPWIARVRPPGGGRRSVVMYGVPSGVAWDPVGTGPVESAWIEDGFLVAAADIALAFPARPGPPASVGRVEEIWIAPAAGAGARSRGAVVAVPGLGLEGDRAVAGTGTFPSGLPGSALTLISAEVCESFSPPLSPDEHRRNLITRGIDLNQFVGREFMIGVVRCRGVRLCEPCMIMQRRSWRPLLRQLIHRAGLRADILSGGLIHAGDRVVAAVGERA
jgi:MOSC domain